MTLVTGIFLLCGCKSTGGANVLSANDSTTSDVNSTSVGVVALAVKSAINDWTIPSGRALMQHHLVQFRLMDESGAWQAPQLSAISERLWPSNIDLAAADAFVDQVAAAAADNPYLLNFLDQAVKLNFPNLSAKFASEGKTVIPDVIAYGIVLQQLTKAMYDDWTLIPVLEGIWKRARKDDDVSQYMELFDFAKLTTVEDPINHFVSYHQSGVVPGSFLHTILPVNILEAIMVDIHEGHTDNARAGWYLMINRPGSPTCNIATEACPTDWAPNHKGIELGMPLPRQWAELYAVWNLSFVTRYGHFPYVFCKLLIPQVNNFKDSPKEYIYNRALALYAHLNYAYIGRADDAKAGKKEIEWRDESLTRLFGKVNLQSGRNYQDTLEKADPSWTNWFHDSASRFNGLH